MDALDDRRAGEAEEVVVAPQVTGPVGEALAPVVLLREPFLLDHRPHRAVEDQNALGQRSREVGRRVRAVVDRHVGGDVVGEVFTRVQYAVAPCRVAAMAAPSETQSSGLVIARIGGVPVQIGASWLVLAAVITFIVGSGAPELGPAAYVIGVAYAVSLLVSVLVHEGAHAAMAGRLGLPVHRVVADLWGGHTAYDARLSTPGKAAAIAVVGPVANLALALVAWVASLAVTSDVPSRILYGVAFVNLLLAVFNLLPGLPLDGGQLVDARVWKATGRREKGLIAAGWTGRVVTLGVVLCFVVRPLLSGDSPSFTSIIWSGLIAAFMWQGATAAIRTGQAREMLGRGTVAQVVRPVPVLRGVDVLEAAAATGGLAVVVDAGRSPHLARAPGRRGDGAPRPLGHHPGVGPGPGPAPGVGRRHATR